MGLAMAVKQTPWLIIPFVVAGIVLESRRLRNWSQGVRDGLRYLGIAVVAFLVPNLPYLLNSPGGWLKGVLTPITSQTVPAGQGLISLSLSLPVGGGSLKAFNAAALIVLVSLIACYLATYPLLKPATFLLPSIVLFFATRSFGSYLVMLIPAAVAAAATVQRSQVHRPGGTGNGWRAARRHPAPSRSWPPWPVPARWSCPSCRPAPPASWPRWMS